MCRSDNDCDATRNQSPGPNEPAAPLDCCGGLNNVDYSKVLREATRFKQARTSNLHVYLYNNIVSNRLTWQPYCCQTENIRYCLFSE